MPALPQSVRVSDVKTIAKLLRLISKSPVEDAPANRQSYEPALPIINLNKILNRHWVIGSLEHRRLTKRLIEASIGDIGSHAKALDAVSKALGFRDWHAVDGYLKNRDSAASDGLSWDEGASPGWTMIASNVPLRRYGGIITLMQDERNVLLAIGLPGAGAIEIATAVARSMNPHLDVVEVDVLLARPQRPAPNRLVIPEEARIFVTVTSYSHEAHHPDDRRTEERVSALSSVGHVAPTLIVHTKVKGGEAFYDLWGLDIPGQRASSSFSEGKPMPLQEHGSVPAHDKGVDIQKWLAGLENIRAASDSAIVGSREREVLRLADAIFRHARKHGPRGWSKNDIGSREHPLFKMLPPSADHEWGPWLYDGLIALPWFEEKADTGVRYVYPCLSAVEKSQARRSVLTNEELKAALAPAEGQYDMWADRAISLVEALDGTGVEPTSDTLLDDMIAIKEDNPAVAAFLDTLPGLSGGNREKADEQLGYCTMQIRAALS